MEGITLSVFHDGQFFTALFERYDGNRYEAARHVFGAEPSDVQLFDFVLHHYERLRFSPAMAYEKKDMVAKNPKRRQRQAARACRTIGMSTKAQEALQAQRQAVKAVLASRTAAYKRLEADRKFEQRRQKRKQKQKGH